MIKIGKMCKIAFSAFVVAVICMPALAQNEAPQPIYKGDITYVTGGYGLEEREAIEATKKNYNLLVMNATRDGKLTAEIAVTIIGKDGQDVLAVDDVGPLLYVKLPAGSYSLKARSNGAEQTRKINIAGGKTVTVNFIWANGGSSAVDVPQTKTSVSTKKSGRKHIPSPSDEAWTGGDSHILGTLPASELPDGSKTTTTPAEE